MKVAIVHGEIAADAGPEEQDTLVQAAFVASGLFQIGHVPFFLPASLNLAKLQSELCRQEPDMVFNLVEALSGRGSLIHFVPALLETLGIPCTGAPAGALYATSNKLLAKERLALAGLPTPCWFDGVRSSPKPFAAGNWIVKSVWEHASLGLDEDSVFSASDEGQLKEVVAAKRNSPGAPWFAERYIEGREFNVALLAGQKRFPGSAGIGVAANDVENRTGKDDPEVLPPAEIRFDAYPEGKIRVVGYRAKWEEASFEFAETRRSFALLPEDQPLLAKLAHLSLKCWRLFGLRGYARVDFRVDSAGAPWILEVNANPCLAPDAGFMAAAAQADLGFTDVLERLIHDAVNEP